MTARRLPSLPDTQLSAALRSGIGHAPEAELLAAADTLTVGDPVPPTLIDSCHDLSALAAPLGGERPPSGCGWHGYAAPGQDQIKARMLKRRRHTLKLRGVL